MVSVVQLVEHRIVVPVVAGSSPVAHPILKKRQAPVAQLDRAPDFESVGRGFESLRARQPGDITIYPNKKPHSMGFFIWFILKILGFRTWEPVMPLKKL